MAKKARTLLREELAAAIQKRDAAERELAEAEEALRLAEDRSYTILGQIREIDEEAERAGDNEDVAAAITAVLGGGSVLELSSPARERAQRRDALDAELNALRQTREKLEPAVKARASGLDTAKHCVKSAIGAVVEDEATTERLIAELLELQRHMLAKRAELRAIGSLLPHACDMERAIDAALDMSWLALGERCWREHEVARQWLLVADQLQTSGEAALPT